jgi:hypothetical protein
MSPNLNPTPLLAIFPSECHAVTNFLEGDLNDFGTGIGQVTTNGLAAAVGEDGRSSGQTYPLLLIVVGGESPDAAAVCQYAVADRWTVLPSG